MLKAKVYNIELGVNVTSGQIDLGGTYRKMYIEMPAFASGGTHYIQGSSDGETFRRIYQDNTASGAAAVFQIAQTASQAMVPVPAGFTHYGVENTSGVSAGITYKLICFD